MNIALRIICMSVILLGIFASPFTVSAADPTVEDLQKKTDSGFNFTTPTFSIPQITPPAGQFPKVDQLKAPTSDKIKLSEDDQASSIVKPPPIKETNTLSPLEQMITSDETLVASKVSDLNPAKTLAQFGYNYFKNTSFTPLNDVPVSPDYLIGPGDTLMLNVWGSIEGTYELIVSRTGEVLLPKVGPAKVAGLPFGKLPDIFRAALSKEFRDFNLAVNMGKLRTIKVFVVGEVVSPGDYTVSSLSTLLNALSAAGGPTKNGSLRTIKIRHTSQTEENVDLYEFFTRGDKSRDVRLSSGDTVFVPVIGRVAAISGAVKRPAIYELKDETTLKDLLALAEGITATGYLQKVQISRVVANEKKKVIDINLDSVSSGKPLDVLTAAVTIQDLDIIRIFPINNQLREHFRLEGHLERPGYYALRKGLRISDAISQDQLLPEYFPDFLEITRLVGPDQVPQKIILRLESIFNHEQNQDLEIKEFDVIRVFSRAELERQPKVKVSGEVLKPGTYRLYMDMTVRDLLIQAGYPAPSAYLASAEINRLKKSDEEVTGFSVIINLSEALKNNPQANIRLEPFDELIVRKIPSWVEETDRYVTLSGEFRFPGVYPIYHGERLSSLIERAGGFTDKAYLAGAKFTRESLRQLQQKRMDEALAKAEEEVVNKQTALATVAASKEELDATKAALEGLKRNIEILKNKRAEGRLLIQISSLEQMKQDNSDIELKGSDSLFVPSDPNAVSIIGQVYNPTNMNFEPQKDAGYYLSKVGGPNKDADEDEIYLVKMDGTVVSKRQTASLFSNKFLSRQINSGDTIIVPQRFEKIAWMRDIKDITTILGQLALTAGVLIAAGL